MNLKQLKAKAFENKSVKQEYDHLESEFELINKLINIRKKSGLTQEQIAVKMGTTKSNVCRMEKLGTHPKVSTVDKYAKACGFKLDFQFKTL
ncbi:helix-turn-helix domain-containing protein [Fangia hongkongensis]|uniref:helix-turn-helix domain-containing protein n=1 Tax=Fangia hongkongensis TaxID=270495 RepID=UPI0003712980|nr:helix-turn-helix transcriptional regulator [Fangia hongkongensis]MBK2124928.1 helix-turn-helix transcriptional regulator [Fangia hongkongensis]